VRGDVFIYILDMKLYKRRIHLQKNALQYRAHRADWVERPKGMPMSAADANFGMDY
jgi:hypothetical protein